MDITEESQERFNLGIERFLEGRPISFKGFLFSKARNSAVVHVDSFSDWAPERSTPDMAREKFAESKAVASELANASPAFKAVYESYAHQFNFCYDYGKGAIILATEVNSQFDWVAR